MTEPAAEPTTEAPEAAQPEDATDWKAEARKWEDRSKLNAKAATDLKQQHLASMTEAQRNVADAEERGRTTATAAFGQRLAKSDFVAAAAKRNPAWDASAVLDDINLARYIGDDGEPDANAIEQAVTRLVPAVADTGPVPMDLGQRQTAGTTPGMNNLIRKAAGRA